MIKASAAYYAVLEALKNRILEISDTKSVSAGDFGKVDLNKQSIFPLAHILVNTITQSDNTLTFNVTIAGLDIVHTYKNATTDLLRGNDNEQDVVNTQAFMLNRLIQDMRKGLLHDEMFEFEGDAQIQFFPKSFENNLAGAEVTIDITMPNNIDIC